MAKLYAMRCSYFLLGDEICLDSRVCQQVRNLSDSQHEIFVLLPLASEGLILDQVEPHHRNAVLLQQILISEA